MHSKETSPLAIASLALSCLGVLSLGLLSIIGIITGEMAKRRIARGEESGYPLAQAGVIVGWVVIAVWLAVPVVILLAAAVLTLMAQVPRMSVLALAVALAITVVLPMILMTLAKRKEAKVWKELVDR